MGDLWFRQIRQIISLRENSKSYRSVKWSKAWKQKWKTWCIYRVCNYWSTILSLYMNGGNGKVHFSYERNKIILHFFEILHWHKKKKRQINIKEEKKIALLKVQSCMRHLTTTIYVSSLWNIKKQTLNKLLIATLLIAIAFYSM